MCGPVTHKTHVHAGQHNRRTLMMSLGLPSFFSSLRSLGLMELTARSASSTKGCALARSWGRERPGGGVGG